MRIHAFENFDFFSFFFACSFCLVVWCYLHDPPFLLLTELETMGRSGVTDGMPPMGDETPSSPLLAHSAPQFKYVLFHFSICIISPIHLH
jgi:hypothetical protein